MARSFASGTLTGASMSSPAISMVGKFTGVIGLLLTYNAGPGTIRVVTGPLGGAALRMRWIDPRDGSANSLVSCTASGLYAIPGHWESLLLILSGGTGGLTDIDYNIFLKPRP